MLYEVLTQRSCRWSIRNIVALEEKGADYALVDVSGAGGAGRADWYLPLNPFGRTPALRHGQAVLIESLLMNEYIDETAPGRPLMPQTAAGRAWARVWNSHNDSTLMPSLTRLAQAGSEEAREQALADVRRELERAEARTFEHATPGGPFWNGPTIGLVDIGWWTFFQTLQVMVAHQRIDDAVLAHPRLSTWRDALLAHPAFAHASRWLDALQPRQVLKPDRRSAPAAKAAP